MGDFETQDIRDIVVEDGDRITPPHREGAMVQCTERSLEGGEVAQVHRDEPLVIANIEIKDKAARPSSKLFREVVWCGWDSAMLNGDLVEQLEAVDEAERVLVLLENAKPAQAIGGIGGLIHARRNLLFDDVADFVVEPWGYRDVALDPRRVRNHWKLHRREELGLEAPALIVVPREGLILLTEEVVQELLLLRPEEVVAMRLVHCLHARLRVATCRNKWW